mmetsp:Transcript_59388/g.67240  ORF Transcript_59388/g.67240 Transcript_59388/m.67240 type:complete len:362 (+) Transcript_59388:2-1087(+)
MSNNNNDMEQGGANDNDERTHQLVKDIRMDILMIKAEEADHRNRAIATERYDSLSAKLVSTVEASNGDEIAVPFKNDSQQEEKEPIISIDRTKMTPEMTKKKSSLFVRGKKFVLVKKKNDNKKATNVLSTKKERWLIKRTKKWNFTKKSKVATTSEQRGMWSSGRKRPSTTMKRIQNSMPLSKIKRNQTTSDVATAITDNKKKVSMVKRIKKSLSLPNAKSNQTATIDPSSNEKKKKKKKKKSSMVKRIKKSMSLKKVNSHQTSSSDLSSSDQKKMKKSSMVKCIKKSLSVKKVKNIHNQKSEALLPTDKKKASSSSSMMKNGTKSSSFKKLKIKKNKSQDADRAESSPFEKQKNMMYIMG